MSLIQTIETDLTAAGQWLETEAEGVAGEVWTIFKGVWTTLEPAAWADLLATVNLVVTKLPTTNDIGTLLQSVLMVAEVQGKSFILALGEGFLNTVIAAIKSKV